VYAHTPFPFRFSPSSKVGPANRPEPLQLGERNTHRARSTSFTRFSPSSSAQRAYRRASAAAPHHLFDHLACPANAAASHGGVLRSLNGHIIICDQLCRHSFVYASVRQAREIHNVACVVLHNEEYSATTIDRLSRWPASVRVFGRGKNTFSGGRQRPAFRSRQIRCAWVS